MRRYRIVTTVHEVSDEEYADERIGGDTAARPDGEPLVKYGYDIQIGDTEADRKKAEAHLYRATELTMADAYMKAKMSADQEAT